MASRIVKIWPASARACGRDLNVLNRVAVVSYVYIYALGPATYGYPCKIYADGSAALCEECAVKLGVWW